MQMLVLASFFEGLDPCIILWLIVIAVFIGVELSTVALTSIWFANRLLSYPG